MKTWYVLIVFWFKEKNCKTKLVEFPTGVGIFENVMVCNYFFVRIFETLVGMWNTDR